MGYLYYLNIHQEYLKVQAIFKTLPNYIPYCIYIYEKHLKFNVTKNV